MPLLWAFIPVGRFFTKLFGLMGNCLDWGFQGGRRSPLPFVLHVSFPSEVVFHWLPSLWLIVTFGYGNFF